MNKFVRTPLLFLGAVEFVGLFTAFYVGSLLIFGGFPTEDDVNGSLFAKALTVDFVMLTAMIAMGLYQIHQRMRYKEVVVRLFVSMFLGCVALAVLFYLFPSLIVPPAHALLILVVAIPVLSIVRYNFGRHIDDNVFRYRTLIYGAGTRAESVDSLRRRADRRGFQIVGRIAAPGDTHVSTADTLEIDGQTVTDIALAKNVDEIVVAMDNRRGNLPVRDLLSCKLRGIDVIDIVEFLERESEKIRVDLLQPGWIIFSEGFQSGKLKRFTKRGLDVFVSALTLAITLPLMILVIVAIKIEDGWRQPVLYRQVRVGKFGRTFSLLKFRSMYVDAEPDGKAIWADTDDSRITRVGRFIRMSRFDELPQVFNILRGDMSLVGPRPERPQFVNELAAVIPYYNERHTIKPGLTGWAQLKYSYGASVEDSVQKLQYDLYYIKNQNVLLDLVILLQTVEVILWSKGAR